MLDTLLTLTEILALGTGSACAIHLMIRHERTRRSKKKQAQEARIEAKVYQRVKREQEQRQAQEAFQEQCERENYKRRYTMLDADTAEEVQVYGNVIQLPYRP